MMPYYVFGWAALAQESVSSTLVRCYSYKCPTVISRHFVAACVCSSKRW
jgi:hypothetical protein